jgi:hypothetical protein
MLTELSQTTYADHFFLVNTAIAETCCGKGLN